MKLGPFVCLVLAACGACLLGMAALPHDRFLRYQALDDHVAPTAHWIYQRIHTDPAPIDVAFVGTSRTGRSVHSGRIEEDLRRQGIAVRVVNLHVVRNGVNMQYVVARELLENRRVKLLVVELLEWEDRKPHPDFIFLADPVDVITAPLFVNIDYLSDLARLPGRQLDLFLATQLQRRGLRNPAFALPPYEGSNLDRAQYVQTLDGVRHFNDESHSLEEMERLRAIQERSVTPPLLPDSLNDLEYRLPRYYLRAILDLARSHGTRVMFLYTPRYGGPAVPPTYARYADQAPLINPWSQVQDFRLWSDVTHVNWEGAQRVTDLVAQELARQGDLR